MVLWKKIWLSNTQSTKQFDKKIGPLLAPNTQGGVGNADLHFFLSAMWFWVTEHIWPTYTPWAFLPGCGSREAGLWYPLPIQLACGYQDSRTGAYQRRENLDWDSGDLDAVSGCCYLCDFSFISLPIKEGAVVGHPQGISSDPMNVRTTDSQLRAQSKGAGSKGCRKQQPRAFEWNPSEKLTLSSTSWIRFQ